MTLATISSMLDVLGLLALVPLRSVSARRCFETKNEPSHCDSKPVCSLRGINLARPKGPPSTFGSHLRNKDWGMGDAAPGAEPLLALGRRFVHAGPCWAGPGICQVLCTCNLGFKRFDG